MGRSYINPNSKKDGILPACERKGRIKDDSKYFEIWKDSFLNGLCWEGGREN